VGGTGNIPRNIADVFPKPQWFSGVVSRERMTAGLLAALILGAVLLGVVAIVVVLTAGS
jgi:hypothetical protein